MNLTELKAPRDWKRWEKETDRRDFVLPTYVCRSLDDGKTWEEPVFLNNPCAAAFIR